MLTCRVGLPGKDAHVSPQSSPVGPRRVATDAVGDGAAAEGPGPRVCSLHTFPKPQRGAPLEGRGARPQGLLAAHLPQAPQGCTSGRPHCGHGAPAPQSSRVGRAHGPSRKGSLSLEPERLVSFVKLKDNCFKVLVSAIHQP